MRTVTINVTEDDILMGVARSCLVCPLALAIGRTFEERVFVSVRDKQVDGIWIELPQSAKDFQTSFDSGKTASPFSFEITLPDQRIPMLLIASNLRHDHAKQLAEQLNKRIGERYGFEVVGTGMEERGLTFDVYAKNIREGETIGDMDRWIAGYVAGMRDSSQDKLQDRNHPTWNREQLTGVSDFGWGDW